MTFFVSFLSYNSTIFIICLCSFFFQECNDLYSEKSSTQSHTTMCSASVVGLVKMKNIGAIRYWDCSTCQNKGKFKTSDSLKCKQRSSEKCLKLATIKISSQKLMLSIYLTSAIYIFSFLIHKLVI